MKKVWAKLEDTDLLAFYPPWIYYPSDLGLPGESSGFLADYAPRNGITVQSP